MPQRVPYQVHGAKGIEHCYADQSTNGGQWNALGLFEFDETKATVIMSNTDTNNCEYKGKCYTVFDALRFIRVGATCDGITDASADEVRSLSDRACSDPPNMNIANLRQVITANNGNEDFEAQTSPVKLLEISEPNAAASADANGMLKVTWATEGVPADRDVKITLFYKGLSMGTVAQTKNSGEATVKLPDAAYLNEYSTVQQYGKDKFRIRIDVQHELIAFSGGWSNQLYAFSQYFKINA